MHKIFYILILPLLFCVSATAATFYVSPLGDNDNTGASEESPFQTVQFAIDQMDTGDLLIVLDGFYTGTLKLKSGINIRAKNPRKVLFSGAEPLGPRFEKHDENMKLQDRFPYDETLHGLEGKYQSIGDDSFLIWKKRTT